MRTGQPLLVHQTMSEEDWSVYQRGMRSGIDMPARWVARHLPLARNRLQCFPKGALERNAGAMARDN